MVDLVLGAVGVVLLGLGAVPPMRRTVEKLGPCTYGAHDDEVLSDDGTGVRVRCRNCGTERHAVD